MKRACHSARIEGIIRAACEREHVTRAQLMEGTQFHEYARARREICRRLREIGLSMPRIGRILGLHHTTVLHHLRKREATPPDVMTMESASCVQIGGLTPPDESGAWAI